MNCEIPAGLDEKYTALHEGDPPNGYLCETLTLPSVRRKFGCATEIQYLKKVPDDEPSYHHPWAEYAQPTIAVSSDGELVFYAGKYETTRRGIEDRVLPGMETVEYLKQPYVQREKLPGRPTELITLGTLEWVKYKSRDGSILKLAFNPSIAPEIAHDQKGNLHVLHGRYVIDAETGTVETRSAHTGVESSMKHARRHHSRSRRHHGRRPHHGRRHNPSSIAMTGAGTGTQRAMRMIMNSVVIGGVATVTVVAMNLGLAKFWPTGSAGEKAATKIGVGLLGGVGLAYAIPGVPSIAAGFSVGGVIDGFLDLYNLYVAPRLAAMTTPAPVPAPVQAPVQPSQGALPAGQAWGQPLPRQYAGYSPAACGVGF